MTQDATPSTDTPLIAERREKLAAIRAQAKASGQAAFPNDFKPTHHAAPCIFFQGPLTIPDPAP